MEHRLQDQIDALRERLVRVEAAVSTLPEMDKKLDGINNTLSKYHGFIGGVAFLFTGVLLFVKGSWAVVSTWMKG